LARISGYVSDSSNLETTLEWLLDFGFGQTQISQWVAATHMKECTLARNCFSAFGANKNINDFFEHIKSQYAATKANPYQMLMLLRILTTCDDIRRNMELSITHRRSLEDIKKPVLSISESHFSIR
jgi:hypothetical protein